MTTDIYLSVPSANHKILIIVNQLHHECPPRHLSTCLPCRKMPKSASIWTWLPHNWVNYKNMCKVKWKLAVCPLPPTNSVALVTSTPSTAVSVHRQSAREKLMRLNRLQFQELSTDVYDELRRRTDTEVQSLFISVAFNFRWKFCSWLFKMLSTPREIKPVRSWPLCLKIAFLICRVTCTTN